MQWEFYIDESGNAGDINPKICKGKLKIEQPVFVIAGVGYPTDQKGELDDYVQHIKGKYGLSNNELKAKSLYRSKPQIFVDLVKYFKHKELPIFIEINDKRYFIACKVVELILRNIRQEDVHPEYIYVLARRISNFICHEMDDDLLAEFAQLSIKRCPDMLRQWFEKALHFFAQHKSKIAEQLFIILKDVENSYITEAQSDENVHERYLPSPDKNHKGEIIALLPHIPAIVSMLQRIIKFTTSKGVTDLRIIHDEQDKFESILLNNIMLMQKPEIKKATAFFFSVDEINIRRSLVIPDNTKVEFGISNNELGLQIADLLAGTIMRIWSEFITGNIGKSTKYITVLRDFLIPYESLHPSLGINFVVPQYDLDSFLQSIG